MKNDLEFEAMRQLAAHPATHHIPPHIQSGAMRTGRRRVDPTRRFIQNIATRRGPLSISVAVDIAKKTITIDGVTWPIRGDTSRDTIVAMVPDKGSATLNRITGAANVHFIEQTALKKFYGECKPAQKLF
jgi:hypothetical protein